MKKQIYAVDMCEIAVIDKENYHLRYRSKKLGLPILLFLHGGPGSCDRPLVIKHQSILADHFTIVCWDQRGAGKSYSRASKNQKLTIEICVKDAARVVRYLKNRFSQQKVYIVGHSWGSVLGTLLAQQYPEDIEAYIGMGQFVCGADNERISYDFTLNEAERRGEKRAVRILKKMGPPVDGSYGTDKNIMIQRSYLQKFGGAMHNEKGSILKFMLKTALTTHEYSLIDYIKYLQGNLYCRKALFNELIQINFFENVQKLHVPVYIIQGRYDYNTPFELAKRWFDSIDAPKKEFVWFEESAHSPNFEEPDKWAKTIRRLLLGQEI